MNLLHRKCIDYSPLRARKTWLAINGICLIWSLLLFFELIYTIKPLDRLEGTRAYLAYNFGTTVIWLIEVGFTIVDMNHTYDRISCSDFLYFRTRQDVELMMELTVALYFFVDSLKVFVNWSKAEMHVRGHYIDAIIGFFAYLYETQKIVVDDDRTAEGGRAEGLLFEEHDRYDAI